MASALFRLRGVPVCSPRMPVATRLSLSYVKVTIIRFIALAYVRDQ